MTKLGISTLGVRTTITSVFGGLASKASGGSFRDGAISAAFVHLFNDEMSGSPTARDSIDPAVRSDMEKAWIESQASSTSRHEEGGFIVLNADGSQGVARWPSGTTSGITRLILRKRA